MLITLAMLAVTCFADQQADLIARIRANPTEDFSQLSRDEQAALAQADAMVYFQEHKDMESGLDIGLAHAFKHHLMSSSAQSYQLVFTFAIEALQTN
jgi:hypothetical protein